MYEALKILENDNLMVGPSMALEDLRAVAHHVLNV